MGAWVHGRMAHSCREVMPCATWVLTRTAVLCLLCSERCRVTSTIPPALIGFATSWGPAFSQHRGRLNASTTKLFAPQGLSNQAVSKGTHRNQKIHSQPNKTTCLDDELDAVSGVHSIRHTLPEPACAEHAPHILSHLQAATPPPSVPVALPIMCMLCSTLLVAQLITLHPAHPAHCTLCPC